MEQQEALVLGMAGRHERALEAATRRTLGPALVLAHRNVAPRRLAEASGARRGDD